MVKEIESELMEAIDLGKSVDKINELSFKNIEIKINRENQEMKYNSSIQDYNEFITSQFRPKFNSALDHL